MATIGYLRVSSNDQSTHSQRSEIANRHNVERWWSDEATSGVLPALQREGFSALAEYVREGDVLVVYAIDRLGRDTVDVLNTVQFMQSKGVSIISMREGFDLHTPIGKAMLTMLAAMAEIERSNIRERQMAGIRSAKAEGRRLGRPKKTAATEIKRWREENEASIRRTAQHFQVSASTVKRASRCDAP
tara:strand:- start:3158 stop:3721 length:564 start_codon:yes stop_codon:yes gene_type:complete